MAWPRAALIAVLVHVLMLVLFTPVLRTSAGAVELVFWGAILRYQDVAPQQSAAPELSGGSGRLESDLLKAGGLLPWDRGLAPDKPDLCQRAGAPVMHEASLRFGGNRVEIRELDDLFADDIPVPVPVKMRLEGSP